MVNKTLSFKNEIYRKLIHFSSLFFSLLYFYNDFLFFFTILFLATIFITCINIYYYQIINLINKNINIDFVIRDNEYRSFWSATLMMFGFLIITYFFSKEEAILSMLITSISDPLAAIFGIKFGQIKLFNNKTLEGSFIFIVSTFLIMIFYQNSMPILILIISLLVALNELFTPMKYDNFSIPIVSALLLRGFNIF